MDLRQLKYFVAIVDAGSFGAAARSLRVTQPALTASVQKLEADLGTQLLQRRDRGVSPTSAGQALYDEGRPLLEDFDALEERIRSHGRDDAEEIRVGLTVLFSMQFMGCIARFISSHRNVAVTLVQDGSPELQQRLAAGEIDVGVLSFPMLEKGITMDVLPGEMGGYDVAVVMREDNPLASREKVGFADLVDESWSALSDHFVLGRLLPERMQALHRQANVAFTNDDWEVLLASVANLGSVCLLPAEFEPLTTRTGLAWVPLDDKANRFDVGIATRQGQEFSPALAEFVAALRQG